MPKSYTNRSKTSSTPRKPFDKDRLISELKIVGQYGLRNKREVWRVQLTLAKIRKAARELLTLPEGDVRRAFEGDAIIRRIVKLGLLHPPCGCFWINRWTGLLSLLRDRDLYLF